VEEDEKPKGFWHTLPGLLTAIAAVITAASGLLVAVLPLKPDPALEKPVARSEAATETPTKSADPEWIDPARIDSAQGDAAQGDAANVSPASTEVAPSPPAVTARAKNPAPARVVITMADNRRIELAGASFGGCGGQKEMTFTYGLSVPFERIRSIDVSVSDTDVRARILLIDGTSVDGPIYDLDVCGSNLAGKFSNYLSKVERVEFRR